MNITSIQLMPEETIRLLRTQQVENDSFSPFEEKLLCGLVQGALQLVKPEQVVDCSNGKSEMQFPNTTDENIISMPCVVSIDGNMYIARLDVTEKDQIPVLLTICEPTTGKFQ